MPLHRTNIRMFKALALVGFLLMLLACNGPKNYGPAASFKLENEKGQLRTLHSYGVGTAETRGDNYLFINFWASWCKPCIDEIPLLKDYANNHANQMRMIGIAVDRVEPAKVFAQRLQIDYPVLFGEHALLGELMQAYGNQREVLPYSVLVDPGGRIIWKHTGLLRARDLQRLPLPSTNNE